MMTISKSSIPSRMTRTNTRKQCAVRQSLSSLLIHRCMGIIFIWSEKKLDDQSLSVVYQTVRSNSAWNSFSNEQIIDAIIRRERMTERMTSLFLLCHLDCHRDSSSRAKLTTFVDDVNRCQINIDTCDTIDVDITDLVIESWCSRFCFRCYTYK